MAGRRRTIDRKAQRTDPEEEVEKAEDEEAEDEEEEGDDDEEGDEEADAEAEPEAEAAEEDADEEDEDAPKKKKKKKVKVKVVAPKRPRATKKAVRHKAVWVIFDNSSKQIETFPFAERAAADRLLTEKSEDAKKGYYLQMIKVPLEEKEKEK